VVLATVAAAVAADVPASPASPDDVRAAIVRAVELRLGQGSRVTVNALIVRAPGTIVPATLVATPDPAARLGRMVRFLLRWRDGAGQPRSGDAQCLIDARVPHARPRRLVARGEVLSASDVAVVLDSPGAVPLRQFPIDLQGARARRDLYPDSPIAAASVALAPAVKSGDEIAVKVTGPGLAVEARAVAAEDGEIGEFVRVVNRESGRRLKGRVVARGQVEVSHGS
jgi:flagella basal body P-ring formation protein FlgA